MRIKAQEIWKNFCSKMNSDSLLADDFKDEMKIFFLSFLCGSAAENRRNKFAQSPAIYFDTDNKAIILLRCSDDDYRFDFIEYNGIICLSFIECITIPFHKTDALPLMNFIPLSEKEGWIRSEKNVSKLIYFYIHFKEIIGKEKAKDMFLDGAGEFIGAKSWVPFYEDTQAYIIYAAWTENRINNETISIDDFSENRCVITFHNHKWRCLYYKTSHLSTMLNYNEYIELFEHIWHDRAKQSGWNVDFEYSENDTTMIFTK